MPSEARARPGVLPGNISNLKSDLRKYNLKLGGNKAELIQRLAEHYERLSVLPQDVMVSAVEVVTAYRAMQPESDAKAPLTLM